MTPRTTQTDPGDASGGSLTGSLLALGVGLTAAGVGAALGIAAERMSVGRTVRLNQLATADDGYGGPPLGSVRGEVVPVQTDDGVRLHVEVHEPGAERAAPGQPPITIVFSHGYALTMDSWHYQTVALAGRYRLVLWDQRGHGRSSSGAPGSSTIDRVGADLEAVLEAVAPEGPLVLIGHSMGGMTVMALAERRPDLFEQRVVGIGLIGTSAGGLGEANLGLAGLGKIVLRMAPGAVRLLARRPELVARGRQLGSDLESVLVRRYSFASPVPPQLVAFAARMIASTRVEVISDFMPTFSSHDKREALAALDGTEVLVLVGDGDLLTPVRHSEEIVQRLPAAEHVVIRDAGHLVQLEHPELVNGYLEELLERAGRAVRGSGRRLHWGRRTVTPIRRRLSRRARRVDNE